MKKDIVKLAIIPLIIIISAVLFFIPKDKVDLSNKTYGEFVNNSTKEQTLYTLTTESEKLNEIISQYEIPMNNLIVEVDYTSEILLEKFAKIEFIQIENEENKQINTILFNLEKDQPAEVSDFFTQEAIHYLTYLKQSSNSTYDNYEKYIEETTIANQSVNLIDENTLVIGNDQYILSESKQYTEPNQDFPNVAINVPVNRKLIAFTFDDGPHIENTQRAMSILEKYNGQGTFFIMGPRAQMFPEIVKDIANRNHQIASHTANHRNLTKLSDDELNLEILETEKIINAITGNDTPLMVRPPYGALDESVKSKIARTFVNWNIDSDDWRKDDPQLICDRMVSASKENGIILMHDLYENTIDAFECAAQKLSDEGYQFVSVDTLLKANHIKIEESKLYFSGNNH